MIKYSPRALAQLDEIYAYSLAQWDEKQAQTYLQGLFDTIDKLDQQQAVSHPIPARFGVDGFYVLYQKHYLFFHWNQNTLIIKTILHERMNIANQLTSFDAN